MEKARRWVAFADWFGTYDVRRSRLRLDDFVAVATGLIKKPKVKPKPKRILPLGSLL